MQHLISQKKSQGLALSLSLSFSLSQGGICCDREMTGEMVDSSELATFPTKNQPMNEDVRGQATSVDLFHLRSPGNSLQAVQGEDDQARNSSVDEH